MLRENFENQEPVRLEDCRGNSAPSTDRLSSSRAKPHLENLGEGLLSDPLAAVMALIPEGFMGEVGATLPERFARGLMHTHYQVSFAFGFCFLCTL